jgi:hypothetical protein
MLSYDAIPIDNKQLNIIFPSNFRRKAVLLNIQPPFCNIWFNSNQQIVAGAEISLKNWALTYYDFLFYLGFSSREYRYRMDVDSVLLSIIWMVKKQKKTKFQHFVINDRWNRLRQTTMEYIDFH